MPKIVVRYFKLSTQPLWLTGVTYNHSQKLLGHLRFVIDGYIQIIINIYVSLPLPLPIQCCLADYTPR